jgi:putative hydrolase of the HAD superfamily
VFTGIARVSAVALDLYETLITEFDPDWTPGPTLAERLGVDEALFATHWAAMRPRRSMGEVVDFPTALQEICAALDRSPAESLLEELYVERRAAKAAPFAAVEGEIVEMLNRLRAAGIGLGLITNAAAEEVEAWEDSVLAPLFDEAVFSHRVGLIKPERGIYLQACERLGVEPGECAFVGDGAHEELAGAARAGLRPMWATWFLDRWPAWRREAVERETSGRFPRLRRPMDLIERLVGPLD